MNGRNLRACLALALINLAPAALAQDCAVRVNAMDIEVNSSAFAGDTGTRETLLSWPRRSLNRLTGTLPSCPSDVTLNFMAGIEGLPNSDGYCLAEGDAEIGLLLVPGERDYRGRCAVSTCQRINGTADEIMGFTNRMAVALYAQPDPDSQIMAHASGAMIMTAGRDVLQSRLTDIASAGLALALSSPAAAAATALSVVSVGGTLWLCNS